MKRALIGIAVLLIGQSVSAQSRYFSRNAHISFYSEAIFENIEAHNKRGLSMFDAVTGQIEFSVLISGFVFSNPLMQEHFNENYLESDRYPKAIFKGRLENIATVAFLSDGVYKVPVTGDLTMHGVTRPIRAGVVFTIKAGNVTGTCEFIIKPADYQIKIPALVRNKVAKSVTVKVNVSDYKLL